MPLDGRARNELPLGLHSIFHRPHAVFYRTTATAIEIVRIIHHRRDIVYLLQYFAVLALGPIVEHLLMIAGKTF